LIEVFEQPDKILVVSRTPVGMRFLFALLAFFPLLAPYELLIRVKWQTYLHPFFALAAIVSLGALVLSTFLVFAALAALNSTVTFDKTSALLTYSTEAPVVRTSSTRFPLGRLTAVIVKERDWSDGAPSYYLAIETVDAGVLETASSWSRQEVEAVKIRIDRFMSNASEGSPAS
jgi:hypothetical protein